MAIYCPKREERIFPEVCMKICPNQWEKRLNMRADDSLYCHFSGVAERKLEEWKKKKLN